jgi:hypothetical protein
MLPNILKNTRGFEDKWIVWIKQILESSQNSILINGNSTTYFKSKKGLRQGDLSLLSYLI